MLHGRVKGPEGENHREGEADVTQTRPTAFVIPTTASSFPAAAWSDAHIRAIRAPSSGTTVPAATARNTRSCRVGPQLTACFTSAPILASSAAVNAVRAKEVGHMLPSSRFALSLKPNVAYLELNFCALWK